MVRYAANPIVTAPPEKQARARGNYLRVHFKNTRETAHAIQGMKANQAIAFLKDVKEHKQAVPFTRFKRGIGRCAQAKQWGVTMGRWPVKSADFLLGLLRNAIANAESKSLETEKMIVTHIQVNQAPKQRRRTYRAHGRIGPYLSHPSHIEIVLTEAKSEVARAKRSDVKPRFSIRQKARAIAHSSRRAITTGAETSA